jgi:predicted DNA-binding transcriptional regulator AlpA
MTAMSNGVAMSTPTSTPTAPATPSALLTIREVCAFFGGLNPSTIYRGIAAGRYPAPVRVGLNTSRWLRHECEAALANMINERAH